MYKHLKNRNVKYRPFIVDGSVYSTVEKLKYVIDILGNMNRFLKNTIDT